MKPFFQNNNKEMYSTHNKSNLLLLKDLLKPKRIKFIYTCLQYQNAYIDKLDDIVNKYNMS